MKRCVLSKLRVDIEKRNPEAYPGGLSGFAVFTQQGRTQDLFLRFGNLHVAKLGGGACPPEKCF